MTAEDCGLCAACGGQFPSDQVCYHCVQGKGPAGQDGPMSRRDRVFTRLAWLALCGTSPAYQRKLHIVMARGLAAAKSSWPPE